jgi:hypothetical protein
MRSFELRSWKGMLIFYVAFVNNLVPAFCQQFSVNTDELRPLVEEWNFAHQQRKVESLKHVYGDSVTYLGKPHSRESLVLLKKRFFQSHPQFSQSIESPVRYVAYSSGVVKADFLLEVKNGISGNHSENAYLILSYDDTRYRIVGEGDSLSDVANGFRLALGAPLTFNPEPAESSDSILEKLTKYEPRTVLKHLSSSMIFSEEVIEMPIRNVVIISSILFITFVCMIVALARSKAKAGNGNKLISKTNGGLKRVEQQAFQRFVVSLFDPLYFSLVSPGNANAYPIKIVDLEFQFRKADVKVFIALKCLYLAERPNGSVKLLSDQTIQQLQDLEQTLAETEFYLIVGMGGKPDDPAETYLLPIHELSGESIPNNLLQQYRKHGMFFYNGGRLK